MANVNERLIKTSQRVKEHGEVFTPVRIVNEMLNQPEIQDALNSLTATFLEPAAGEGAFLTKILERKLNLADRRSLSIEEFEQNALIVLTTLYGIELLVDNTELLVMNMYHVFYRKYVQQLGKYSATESKAVVKSAMVIIMSNMVQGNALTGMNKDNNDIVFSEWKLLPIKRGVLKIQRTEYTLNSIENDGPSLDGELNGHGSEELSLFELDSDDETEKKFKYDAVKAKDIYKELKRRVE